MASVTMFSFAPILQTHGLAAFMRPTIVRLLYKKRYYLQGLVGRGLWAPDIRVGSGLSMWLSIESLLDVLQDRVF